MRTRQLALTGAAIAVLASLAGGASPALASKASCSAGSTLAISNSARVFVVKRGSARRVYGCSTRTFRRTYLGRAGGEGVDTSVIAVKGRRVAYVRTFCGEGGCGQSVFVYDLTKREDVSGSEAAPGGGSHEVTDILLSRNGTVAWIVEAIDPSDLKSRHVSAREPGKGVGKPLVPIATGLDIVSGSLALAGTTLYWTQGTAKSAPLP